MQNLSPMSPLGDGSKAEARPFTSMCNASSATVAASPIAARASPVAVDALRRVTRASPLSDNPEDSLSDASTCQLPPPARPRHSFGLNMAGVGGAKAAPPCAGRRWRPLKARRRHPLCPTRLNSVSCFKCGIYRHIADACGTTYATKLRGKCPVTRKNARSS